MLGSTVTMESGLRLQLFGKGLVRALVQMVLAHIRQHTLASVFHQIQYIFKPLITTVVRVGHYSAVQGLAKVRQVVQFVALRRWAQTQRAGVVFMVHHQY